MALRRPLPPDEALDWFASPVFFPAPEVERWARAAFIDQGGSLYNESHAHLNLAEIGFLWTNCPYSRQMMPVSGQAQLVRPHPALSKWDKERQAYQLRQWFGREPDFVITLYAPYAAEADHWSFCALVEHELLHCSLRGYSREGKPLWAIKGHDVEEHVEIVERYGVGAAAGRTKDLVAAAKKKPTVGRAQVSAVCGTCLKAA